MSDGRIMRLSLTAALVAKFMASIPSEFSRQSVLTCFTLEKKYINIYLKKNYNLHQEIPAILEDVASRLCWSATGLTHLSPGCGRIMMMSVMSGCLSLMPPGSSATPLPKHICHVLSLVDTSDQPTPTSETGATLCHADAVMWMKRKKKVAKREGGGGGVEVLGGVRSL